MNLGSLKNILKRGKPETQPQSSQEAVPLNSGNSDSGWLSQLGQIPSEAPVDELAKRLQDVQSRFDVEGSKMKENIISAISEIDKSQTEAEARKAMDQLTDELARLENNPTFLQPYINKVDLFENKKLSTLLAFLESMDPSFPVGGNDHLRAKEVIVRVGILSAKELDPEAIAKGIQFQDTEYINENKRLNAINGSNIRVEPTLEEAMDVLRNGDESSVVSMLAGGPFSIDKAFGIRARLAKEIISNRPKTNIAK